MSLSADRWPMTQTSWILLWVGNSELTGHHGRPGAVGTAPGGPEVLKSSYRPARARRRRARTTMPLPLLRLKLGGRVTQGFDDLDGIHGRVILVADRADRRPRHQVKVAYVGGGNRHDVYLRNDELYLAVLLLEYRYGGSAAPEARRHPWLLNDYAPRCRCSGGHQVRNGQKLTATVADCRRAIAPIAWGASYGLDGASQHLPYE